MSVFTMYLSVDEHSITVADCPNCGAINRLATFDIIGLTENGCGKLSTLTRCYECEPYAEDDHE